MGSAELKVFMEETLRPRFLEQRWKDKLAAGFTNSAGKSGDKLLVLQQLAGFAAQHGMVWVTLGQLPGWQTSAGSADENRLASFLGLMAQSNADQGPDLAPLPATGRRPSGSASASARPPTAGLVAACPRRCRLHERPWSKGDPDTTGMIPGT